ncbi:MAG: pseudouridine synthase [Proteobacteria bacterium]|jgi:23S rRNA pseudouridine2457 synthase|nr:pseudouridine synthase [Pseudomonadota bacterium]
MLTSQLVVFNKPFGVLSQFSPAGNTPVLADFINLPEVYPAGRLDKDSEGLLLLTDDGVLQHCIAHPRQKMRKRYWVQVEGIPDNASLARLEQGIVLKDGMTAPATARIIEPPDVWPRNPPVRYRARIPTCWLELGINEGRNRQVRRMTAAAGFPTLRLIRYAIGNWTLEGLSPGQWKLLNVDRNEICQHPHHRKSSPARHGRRHYRAGRPVSDGRGNRQW